MAELSRMGYIDRNRLLQLEGQIAALQEQLNHRMRNVDTENLSDALAAKLASAAADAAQSRQRMGQLEQNTGAKAAQLRAEILANAELTLAKAQVKMEAGQAALLSTVDAQYTAKSETAALSQTLSSQLQQTADAVDLQFAEANAYTLEVDGRLAQLIEELKTYIRMDAEGISIGRIDSPFTTLLDHARLSFRQSGVEVAYISNHKMYITRAEIADGLTIGSAARGYFDWQMEGNGSLSLTRRKD